RGPQVGSEPRGAGVRRPAVRGGHEPVGVELERRVQQPSAQCPPNGLYPELHLRLPHGTGQQAPGGGRHLLRSRAQGPAGDALGSTPPAKLKPISTALQWATNIGHPGPANPAESEIFDTFVLPTMFANAATGRMSAKQALDEAHQQAKKIFEKWRGKGLVAGGSGDR